MSKRAMTLIEIMIAILLIAIALSAIIVLIPQVMVSDQKAGGVITATSIAQDRLEEAEKTTFRNLHTLVETDTAITQNNMQFKRTTVVGYQIDSRTATTITDNDIDDETSGVQSWTTNEWQYYVITIASGTAKGKNYQISSNTADTISCSGANFINDGVASGDRYYINLASVEITTKYKVTIEATISPYEKTSESIGLTDTPAGVEYKHPTDKWKDIILKTILVENE